MSAGVEEINEFYPQGQCMQQLVDGQHRLPGEAYAQYVSSRQAAELPDPDYYFSTTITSGGFHRLEGIDFAKATTYNHILAKGLSKGVIAKCGLDENAVILPSDLGKVAGWSQSDYLLFWVHVLHGSQAEGALSQDEKFQTDYYQELTAVMSNPDFSDRLRERAYREMMEHMRAVIMDKDSLPGIHNRPMLVPLVDDDRSLGCRAERIWNNYWRYPVKLKNILPSLDQDTRDLVTRVQDLGASVMGAIYDKEQAQKWADYYLAELVNPVDSLEPMQ